ncbi:hypothetical protein [Parasitella parasitica]|uniref:Uncharacterized protein n=1 Tax=Parasitella parasitica TaxID=35722 RepID=A0A0B7N698_9FUNG|nr:hypothetical protein [Parasitella parasitica]
MSGQLPNEKCFQTLPPEEVNALVELQSRFDGAYDSNEYEVLVDTLVKASLAIASGTMSTTIDVRRALLSVKEEFLIIYLDRELPPWKQYMENTLKHTVLNLARLFLRKCQLDFSVFYLIDNTIKHPEIISAYHDHVARFYLKSHEGGRVYNIFYNKKCRPLKEDDGSSTTTVIPTAVLPKKRVVSQIENELKKMRSFSDFIKSRKRMRIYQASSSHNMFIITTEELKICVPPLDSIMRGLGGIISVDYRINVFLATYLGTLAAFIPTFQDFELAQKEGMFETDMRYCDFKNFCTSSFVPVEDYDEHLFNFVVSANEYFYQYFNAFWRDLTNKLMFEPVSFYLTFMATVFSLLSLIQVLQNAKIIPPLY